MPPAIALFARAPVPGRVKTRLLGPLSPEAACDLHRAFVLDLWDTLTALAPRLEPFLYSDQDHPDWRNLAGAQFRLQQGASLGERMLQCFTGLHAAGYGPLLILGSDSPLLPAAALATWPALLVSAPALLGPTTDGGYYAVGCREPHPRMFEDVPWSTAATFTGTVAAFRRLGWEPALLPAHYDVDTPADLARLASEPSLPPHTRLALGSTRSESL
jgi:rSAM/selenodomain-associated transferase 1